MSFEIVHITTEGELLEKAKQLFIAYQKELNADLCFQSFDKELQNPLKKYGSPAGALFIVEREKLAIGCVALKQLADGSCEMKRLYVEPAYRKYGVGKMLVETIINAAKELGYTKMKLDTLERLQPAIKLYEQYGFIKTNSYYHNPLPEVVYMEKEI